jgi:hydrogenase maturation protease
MSKNNKLPHILIAGVGNDLRQDDAFGIELIRRLISRKTLPENLTFMEVGIGGIHLVQKLQDGYEVLIILDAVDWDGEAGQIFIRETEVGNIKDMPTEKQRAFLADMHYTNPTRALMLAKGVNVLPEKVYILGCKTKKHDDFEQGMSEIVEQALPEAEKKLLEWIEHLNNTFGTIND